MSASESDFLSLVTHKIAPFQFDLSVGAVNASIRDQIVRAQMVVRALWQLEQEKKPDRRLDHPLLICGAGIAGLAAADEARRLEMGFVLVEKNSFPSGALAGTGKRYLSPTMYEWPAPLFNEHTHPRRDGSFLGAETKTGFKLAFGAPVEIGRLRKRLRSLMNPNLKQWQIDAVAGTGRYWFIPNASLTPDTKDKLQALLDVPTGHASAGGLPPIELSLAGGAKRKVQSAYMLFAGGFSAERTEYEGFTFNTPPFWKKDRLTANYFGLRKWKDRVSAFIAGAGDGAIQDALRCLVVPTVAHPLSLWEKIATAADTDKAGLEPILREVLSLDNYATIAFLWSGDKDVFKSVDERYQEMAKELLVLVPDIMAVIACILRKDVDTVHIQRNRQFFTRCYPLNRFLIHLMETVLAELGSDPSGRAGYPLLTFGHGKPDGARKSRNSLIWNSRVYHKVVIRTGAENPHFQTIGLKRINPARFSFGRIPPPFMPAKI
jgi:hypothetical protein